MQTFYRTFHRPGGKAVIVEYVFYAGTDTTYSPMYGADGGDAAVATIITAFDQSGFFVTLTDAEAEEFEAKICAEPPEYEPLADDVI